MIMDLLQKCWTLIGFWIQTLQAQSITQDMFHFKLRKIIIICMHILVKVYKKKEIQVLEQSNIYHCFNTI